MKTTDRTEFARNLAVVAEFFEKQLSDSISELYWAALQELSIEEFKAACGLSVRSLRFFPKPVDFIELIRGKADPNEAAAIAWSVMLDHLDPYDSVKFTDPVIHAVVEALGGWRFVSSEWLDDRQIDFQRRDFAKLYNSLAPAVRAGTHRVPERLIGIIEEDNARRGFDDFIPKTNVVRVLEGPKMKQLGVAK